VCSWRYARGLPMSCEKAGEDAPAAICCEGVGKAYTIYSQPQDRLWEWLGWHSGHGHPFWALRDISVTIRRGETVGIVGRNGSGKSTLLQLVAGVIRPTEGRLTTSGRIGALLELGSCFNQEFTGRENVRLGASVLGLNPDTIEARIPDIAHFADIGPFFDRPVRLYSSGMQARLAFALVSHVDADILIVDEALAVGDAAFAQKCMRFLRAFRERGTLCFVSHDIAAVINLCDSALWLEKGAVRAFDKARLVCREYAAATCQKPVRQQEALSSGGRSRLPASTGHVFVPWLDTPVQSRPDCTITSVDLCDDQGASLRMLRGGERLRLLLAGRIIREVGTVLAGFILKDRLGQALFASGAPVNFDVVSESGRFEVEFEFDLPALRAGNFSLTALLIAEWPDPVVYVRLDECVVVRVDPTQITHGLLPIPVVTEYTIIQTKHGSKAGRYEPFS